MSRVLISGAAGFTGRHLAARLAVAGHEVHGLVHERDFGALAIADVWIPHSADLHDQASLQRVIDVVRPDRVVHLAAIAFVAHGDVDAMYRTNVVGTRHLLEALVASGLPIESVLLASSANIYGNRAAGVLDEATPPDPANDYGVTKLAMEYVARLYTARLPIVVVRPFNYTGRGQSPDFLVPKIVDHVRRRSPVIELGNLDVARDFSDVRNVVVAYERLIQAPAAVGKTFNICSGHARSLRDVIGMLTKISGHKMELRINPAFVRPNEVKSLCGSRARLDAAIGVIDTFSFDETLRWMLEA